MKIKKYFQFISEELVSNISKIKLDTSNTFKDIFTNDVLLLRQFIQENMPGQNLKYLGAGCIGLAFKWLKSSLLPDDFYKKGFIGEKTPDSSGKIIKFSASLEEFEGSKKLIEKNGGPGFAKYYWIKEVELPHNQRYSSTLGAPAPWHYGKKSGDTSLRTRMGDQLQHNPPEQFQKWIDDKKQKGTVKMDKSYLICIEELKMLNKVEENLGHLLHQLYCRKCWNDEGNVKKSSMVRKFGSNDFNLDPLLDGEKLDRRLHEIWNDKENLSKTAKQRFGGDYERIIKEIFDLGESEFVDFAKKYCRIHKEAGDIPTSDIHGGNMGWRGSELVAFDCM